MFFDIGGVGNKSNRDKILTKLPKPPGLMISASGISKTIILPSDVNELSNRLKLLLQEKQAGNNSEIINEKILVIVEKIIRKQTHT